MPPPSSEACFTPLSADSGKRAPGSASPSSPREQHSLLGHDGHYGSFQTGRSSGAKGFQAASPPRKFGNVLDGTSESRPLSFWPLVALIFYTASGGPFGIEGLVADVGPAWALIGYLVFPLIWSVPEGLLTAELASAFPENAGAVAWVSTAFGEFPGYLRGSLSWMSGVIDNAIYPVLFVDYLSAAHPVFEEPAVRWAIIWSFTASLTYLCVRGVDLAGRIAIGVCLFALLPFLVMCLIGMFRIDVARCWSWTNAAGQVSGGGWMQWANVIFWNLNAFDGTASLAGQVQSPGRTFPRAMLLTIALVVVSYVLPLFIAAASTDIPYATWHDGTFTEVAHQLGGPLLALWVVLAAAVSNVGLFLAEMNSDAYQMMGMAECGLLPACLAHKSKEHGTPVTAITVSAAVIMVMSVSCSFDELITMINWLYSLAIFFEIAAFIKLRYDHPHLPRPYRVPLSNHAITLLMVLPLAFVAVIVFTATFKTWLISGSLALLALISYHVFKEFRARGLVKFYQLPLQQRATAGGSHRREAPAGRAGGRIGNREAPQAMTRVDSKAQGSGRTMLEDHDVATLAGGLAALRTSDEELEQSLKVQTAGDEMVSGQAPPTDEEEEGGSKGPKEEERAGEGGAAGGREEEEEAAVAQREEEEQEEEGEGKEGGDDHKEDTILFIGDLARGLTEDDLQDAFSVVGKVMSIDIKRDKQTGRNLGYGFIQMGSHEEACEAKRRLHEAEISGRKIRIGWAQRNTALFVGDLDEALTTEELRQAFGKFGPLIEDQTYVRSGRLGRFGFVKFKTRQHAETARREMHGVKLRSRPIRVVWHHPQTSRSESSLSPTPASTSCATAPPTAASSSSSSAVSPADRPPSAMAVGPPRPYCVHVHFEIEPDMASGQAISESTLISIFAPFGEVIGATLPSSGMALLEAGAASGGRRRGFAFVNFSATPMGRRCALEAIRSLHGQVVQGIRLQCSFSKKPATVMRPYGPMLRHGMMPRLDSPSMDYGGAGGGGMPPPPISSIGAPLGPAAAFPHAPYPEAAHGGAPWHQQMHHYPLPAYGPASPAPYPYAMHYPQQNYYGGASMTYPGPYSYYYGGQQDYYGRPMGGPPPLPTTAATSPMHHHHAHHHAPPPPASSGSKGATGGAAGPPSSPRDVTMAAPRGTPPPPSWGGAGGWS